MKNCLSCKIEVKNMKGKRIFDIMRKNEMRE